jgi:hypothetical protein
MKRYSIVSSPALEKWFDDIKGFQLCQAKRPYSPLFSENTFNPSKFFLTLADKSNRRDGHE